MLLSYRQCDREIARSAFQYFHARCIEPSPTPHASSLIDPLRLAKQKILCRRSRGDIAQRVPFHSRCLTLHVKPNGNGDSRKDHFSRYPSSYFARSDSEIFMFFGLMLVEDFAVKQYWKLWIVWNSAIGRKIERRRINSVHATTLREYQRTAQTMATTALFRARPLPAKALDTSVTLLLAHALRRSSSSIP